MYFYRIIQLQRGIIYILNYTETCVCVCMHVQCVFKSGEVFPCSFFPPLVLSFPLPCSFFPPSLFFLSLFPSSFFPFFLLSPPLFQIFKCCQLFLHTYFNCCSMILSLIIVVIHLSALLNECSHCTCIWCLFQNNRYSTISDALHKLNFQCALLDKNCFPFICKVCEWLSNNCRMII